MTPEERCARRAIQPAWWGLPARNSLDRATARWASWPDTLGLESEYDYDPVWAKCLALRVVPTFHSASQGVGTRLSYSNFVYNHIGHFAVAGEAVCKSLFMAGVTRRFPRL